MLHGGTTGLAGREEIRATVLHWGRCVYVVASDFLRALFAVGERGGSAVDGHFISELVLTFFPRLMYSISSAFPSSPAPHPWPTLYLTSPVPHLSPSFLFPSPRPLFSTPRHARYFPAHCAGNTRERLVKLVSLPRCQCESPAARLSPPMMLMTDTTLLTIHDSLLSLGCCCRRASGAGIA